MVRRGWLLGLLFLGVSVPSFVQAVTGDPRSRTGDVSDATGAQLLEPVSVGHWERISQPAVRVVSGGGPVGRRQHLAIR